MHDYWLSFRHCIACIELFSCFSCSECRRLCPRACISFCSFSIRLVTPSREHTPDRNERNENKCPFIRYVLMIGSCHIIVIAGVLLLHVFAAWISPALPLLFFATSSRIVAMSLDIKQIRRSGTSVRIYRIRTHGIDRQPLNKNSPP